MAFTKADALYKQVNGELVELSDDEKQAIVDQWNTPEVDNRPYDEKRRSEYPPIGDQLDALFHAGVFPADMAAQLQAVKDKYPND
jgi:hypothetical protein